jgi:hypothetical protein
VEIDQPKRDSMVNAAPAALVPSLEQSKSQRIFLPRPSALEPPSLNWLRFAKSHLEMTYGAELAGGLSAPTRDLRCIEGSVADKASVGLDARVVTGDLPDFAAPVAEIACLAPD